MKQSILAILAIAFAVPAFAQIRPPVPGTGTCPDSCISIRTPTGALLVCCGEEEGCVNCAPECVASCPDGKYGGCTDLGGSVEETCSKGCSTFCGSDDYTICSIGGQSIEPAPAGCP
ncbi:hypothetical protein BU26DRAFT_520435 [Trematosphaeria pertusa]|uniref:4Fe-4S ferredoxin-type domain-containing protein n=1 Tax=Trematosphaeria pertusa TaxID=390896 RepID=A0A6A6ICA2_9PLEO|nr:uncharacterized protein BU26DRAFT_520435 [Trematosphaeria pertusa]KAF2247180.1 hypothetical protein BU26DRAFT_520435 [Trematosphaeria pertusa]